MVLSTLAVENWVDLPVPVAFAGPKNRYEPLEWAKQHCPSYITNDAVIEQGVYYYRFYFGREQDRMWFALKWL